MTKVTRWAKWRSITLPGCMSHASVPPEIAASRKPARVGENFGGIEDADDLIAGLDQALSQSFSTPTGCGLATPLAEDR
jgi:cystathionine beta-lyase/cystathionine gamma-synthase